METTSFLRNRYWVLRHGKSIPNERGIIVSSMENGRRSEFQLGSEGVNQAELAGNLFLKELETSNIALENVRICYSPFSRTNHTAKVVATVLNLPFESPQCKQWSIDTPKPPNLLDWPFRGVILSSDFKSTTCFLTCQSLKFRNLFLIVISVMQLLFISWVYFLMQVMDDLRERYFGPSFELMSHDKYAEIWDIDEQDPLVGPEGGESVKDVACRLASALVTMESEFEGCAILVVSHGDPLQILQTILNAANQHKESSSNDLVSRLKAVQVASILSQHREYALLTGELRAVI